MEKKYFDPKDLAKFGTITKYQEEMGKKFFEWYGSVFKGDTALTEREKSLIALAVAHTVQCPYCIDAYTSACLEKGADEEQMMEAVHVAAAIKSGSTLVYGVQMMNQAEKMSM
jgi:alkylhydroperoxidase/carboxymuconolactone decarboxylase family protein